MSVWKDCGHEVSGTEQECLYCRIAELEAREPLCRCADEVRCDYLKRIAELEAEVVNSFKTLIDMYANYDRQGVIETLEALYLEQKDE